MNSNSGKFEKMYSDHFGIVLNLALKFSPSNSVLEDFISEGKIALVNSINSFDSERGTRFSTYCYKSVKNRLINFSKKQNRIILVPLTHEIEISQKSFTQAKEKFADVFYKLTSKEKKSVFSNNKTKEEKRCYNSAKRKMRLIKIIS